MSIMQSVRYPKRIFRAISVFGYFASKCKISIFEVFFTISFRKFIFGQDRKFSRSYGNQDFFKDNNMLIMESESLEGKCAKFSTWYRKGHPDIPIKQYSDIKSPKMMRSFLKAKSYFTRKRVKEARIENVCNESSERFFERPVYETLRQGKSGYWNVRNDRISE